MCIVISFVGVLLFVGRCSSHEACTIELRGDIEGGLYRPNTKWLEARITPLMSLRKDKTSDSKS